MILKAIAVTRKTEDITSSSKAVLIENGPNENGHGERRVSVTKRNMGRGGV